MSYLLLHNLEEYTYKKILESYEKDGYMIIHKENKDTLIKKSNLIIKDEDIYIKVLFSQLNKNKLINNSKGLVIDITKAFLHAYKKNGFDKFDNIFIWHIRNILIRNAIGEENEEGKRKNSN